MPLLIKKLLRFLAFISIICYLPTKAQNNECASIECLMEQAKKHHALRHNEEAIDLYSKIIETDPTLSEAYLNRALVKDDMGDSSAVLDFQTAKNLSAKASMLHSEAVRKEISNHNSLYREYTQTTTQCLQAKWISYLNKSNITNDMKNSKSAEIRNKKRNLSETVAVIMRVKVKSPGVLIPDSVNLVASSNSDSEIIAKQAIQNSPECFKTLPKSFPSNSEDSLNLEFRFVSEPLSARLSSKETAKECSTAECFYKQGKYLHAEGDFQQALKLYNKAIELNPTIPEIYLSRNNLNIGTGKNRPFKEDLKTANDLYKSQGIDAHIFRDKTQESINIKGEVIQKYMNELSSCLKKKWSNQFNVHDFELDLSNSQLPSIKAKAQTKSSQKNYQVITSFVINGFGELLPNSIRTIASNSLEAEKLAKETIESPPKCFENARTELSEDKERYFYIEFTFDHKQLQPIIKKY